MQHQYQSSPNATNPQSKPQFDSTYDGFFGSGSGPSKPKFAEPPKKKKAKAPRKNPFEGLKNLKKGKE